MSQTFQFKVEPTDQGERLDKFLMAQFRSPLILSLSNGLAGKMPEYSRAVLQKAIKEKKILLNGKETKASAKLKAGDIIDVELKKSKIDLSPDQSVKFEIIHDEKDFAVIDKPAGLVVYPGIKHEEKTLVNGLLAKWPEIRNVGDPEYSGLRPGIVHRLDKDTSGIMIIAKNNAAFEYFKNLFKNREVKKTYIALAHGILKPREGIIDFPIRRSKTAPPKQVAIKEKTLANIARPALTRFTVKKYLKDTDGNEYTLAEAKPETGRMHQIRVHFAALGHNIVGDKIYKYNKARQLVPLKSHFLHAAGLGFISPAGKTLEFSAPLPKELNGFLKTLADIEAQNID